MPGGEPQNLARQNTPKYARGLGQEIQIRNSKSESETAEDAEHANLWPAYFTISEQDECESH